MLPTPPHRPAPTHGADAGPLSSEHMLALEEARVRSKKVRRAASVAAVSGWTMGVFGVITLLSGLFGDWVSAALGAALTALAWNELRGGVMLRRFEPAGARRLGYNQLILAGLIVAYAGYSMIGVLRTSPLAAAGGSTGDPQMDAMVSRISNMVAFGVYGGIGVVGIIAPGLTAWYYFTRAGLVRRVVNQTPPWVIQTMRAAA